MPRSIGRFRLGYRPPGRPFRPRIPERPQLVVGHVGPDSAVALLDPLLALGPERIDQLIPRRRMRCRLAGLAGVHVPGNSVMIAAGQLRRIAEAAGQVVGRENLHDFLTSLHERPPSFLELGGAPAGSRADGTDQWWGDFVATWGIFMAVPGEIS